MTPNGVTFLVLFSFLMKAEILFCQTHMCLEKLTAVLKSPFLKLT